MAEEVTIAVDAMGGDDAPSAVLDGVDLALSSDPRLSVILCGNAEYVQPFAASHDRCVACPTTQVIAMYEHPSNAVREKKDSSIVVACRLVKEGTAQGFFSAGSTGACLAGATLVMGRIKGVKRPALGQVLPSYAKPTMLIDVGANADCKAEYLLQFAEMGLVYMNKVMGVDAPTVGLLNIGEEETKGSVMAQEAHRLLAASIPSFVGNVEGRDVLAGVVDVIVTDGFTGNVTLKNTEGNAKVLFQYIKDAFYSSLKTKMGAALVKSSLAEMKTRLSPETYGGTPLLGVKGACIVGHGSSNALAVKNGIFVAATTVREQVSQRISDAVNTRCPRPSTNGASVDGAGGSAGQDVCLFQPAPSDDQSAEDDSPDTTGGATA